MPKISVVIPAYNRARFLPETIESVLAQSLHDFDIIVVDDGSTDNTAEVVSALPVRYFLQINQGAPAARNKGMQLTKSEYVVFLDSDDVLMENALQKGAEALDTNPEAGFSYGQAYIIDEEGNVLGLRGRHSRHPYVHKGWKELRQLIYGCHIPSPAVMVRRRCLEEVGGFNPAFVYGSQDLELWVRLAKKYSVVYISEPIAKYRTHSQTISASRQLAEIERTHTLILESIFRDAEVGPLLAYHRYGAYVKLFLSMAASAYYRRRHSGTARQYLFKAIQGHPTKLFNSLGLQWLLMFAKTLMPWHALTWASRYKRLLRRFVLVHANRSLSIQSKPHK